MSATSCSKCTEPLPDDIEGEPRMPSPKCGATARHVQLQVHSAVHMHFSAHGTLTDATLPGLPSVVLPLVLLGARNSEGSIIESVTPAWLAVLRVLQSDPASAHQLTPYQWEEIVAGAYGELGYSVTLTPRSGDKGRDFIAELAGRAPVRLLGQVKAYHPGHLVTAEHVRSLVGVMSLDNADRGVIATTSDFAPRLRSDALLVKVIPDKVTLYNRADLITWLGDVAEESP